MSWVCLVDRSRCGHESDIKVPRIDRRATATWVVATHDLRPLGGLKGGRANNHYIGSGVTADLTGGPRGLIARNGSRGLW